MHKEVILRRIDGVLMTYIIATIGFMIGFKRFKRGSALIFLGIVVYCLIRFFFPNF